MQQAWEFLIVFDMEFSPEKKTVASHSRAHALAGLCLMHGGYIDVSRDPQKEKKAIKAHAKVKVPVSKVLIKSKSTLAIYC